MNDKEIHDNYLQLIKETEKTLKPCPFCGASVTMKETEDGMGYDKEVVIRISCATKDCYTRKDLGLETPRWSNKPYDKLMKENCEVVKELAKRWNRRAE
jgi:C4-type Zn-finger protein